MTPAMPLLMMFSMPWFRDQLSRRSEIIVWSKGQGSNRHQARGAREGRSRLPWESWMLISRFVY